eukprot:SAG11_NODE_34914_length_269_cov_0.917647_1_plen_52_part_01
MNLGALAVEVVEAASKAKRAVYNKLLSFFDERIREVVVVVGCVASARWLPRL